MHDGVLEVRLPLRPEAAGPVRRPASGPAVHDFGLSAGTTRTLCYQATGAAPTVLGPTLVARRGVPIEPTVHDELYEHPLGALVDTDEVHGAQESARTAPRASLHLHGGNTEPGSDGGPLDDFPPGTSRTYSYADDQESAGLWYHDHALGITRLDVWAGLAGGYLLRDANDPGDGSTGLPAGPYEVPLVLVVDRTLYRFRVYNGSNSRTYDLRWRVVTTGAALGLHVIGTDGGLLDAPVPRTSLVLAPGERADLLVDLSGLPAGARVRLSNRAKTPYPDGPRPLRLGGAPLPELLQLTALGPVVAAPPLPTDLRVRTHPVPRLASYVGAQTRTRTMTLVELEGESQPLRALLNNRRFDDDDALAHPVAQNTLEVWELVNTTVDAHPIHLHLVQFQVLDRQLFDAAGYLAAVYGGDPEDVAGAYPPPPVTPFLRGRTRRPGAHEAGWKDTVLAMPGEVTRIAVPFGQPAGLPPVMQRYRIASG